MLNWKKSTALVAVLATVTLSAACEKEGATPPTEPQFAAIDSTFSNNPNRVFTQVERHANPLVMEVFVQKREHDAHDAFPPVQDPGHFTDDIVEFVTTVAGRDEPYARAIASVLLGTEADRGDKLTIYTARQAGTTAATAGANANVGWLTYVLAPGVGYGGRKLSGDDTVDKGTAVVFGNALGNNNNNSPGLVGDNVPANDKAPLTTFPYFPAPTVTP